MVSEPSIDGTLKRNAYEVSKKLPKKCTQQNFNILIMYVSPTQLLSSASQMRRQLLEFANVKKDFISALRVAETLLTLEPNDPILQQMLPYLREKVHLDELTSGDDGSDVTESTSGSDDDDSSDSDSESSSDGEEEDEAGAGPGAILTENQQTDLEHAKYPSSEPPAATGRPGSGGSAGAPAAKKSAKPPPASSSKPAGAAAGGGSNGAAQRKVGGEVPGPAGKPPVARAGSGKQGAGTPAGPAFR